MFSGLLSFNQPASAFLIFNFYFSPFAPVREPGKSSVLNYAARFLDRNRRMPYIQSNFAIQELLNNRLHNLFSICQEKY
jgi:hypothetical protein